MEWFNFIVDNPIFIALAKTLLHFSWQGVLVAAALFLLLKNTNNRRSNLRYATSLIALSLCVISPVATFISVYDPHVALQPEDVKQTISNVSDSAVQLGTTISTLDDSNHVSWPLATAELADMVSHWRLDTMLPFLAMAWMIGVVLLSSKLIVQMINVYQIPLHGTSPATVQLQHSFEQLMEQLGVNFATRLLISNNVDVPMVIGWLKPVVLLPASMVVGLTPKQLEMLLAHELAHVRRHDYIVNFLQTFVEVMLFFHPGVKWISAQIRSEREYCCDDIAVSHCGSAVAYATALTDAEMSRLEHIPHLAMAASGGDLKQRVFRVVGHADCSGSTDGRLNKGHWAGGMLAAIFSLMIVMFLFTAKEVVGMTTHTDKTDKKDKFLVLIEPPKVEEKAVRSGEALSNDDEPNESQPVSKDGVISSDLTVSELPSIELTVSEQSTSEPSTSEKLKLEQSLSVDLIADESSVQQSTAVQTSNLKNTATDHQKTELATQVTQEPLVKDKAQTVAQGFAEQETTPKPDNTAEIAVTSQASASELSQIPSIDEESLGQLTTSTQKTVEAIEPSVKSVAPSERALVVKKSAVLVKSATPAYPRQALMKKLSGDVSVSFEVNTKGRVVNIIFDEGSHRSFRNSVKRALSKWRFEPATEDGKTTTVKLNRIFSFMDPDHEKLTITGSRIARL